MKKEKFCYNCDTEFVIKSTSKEPISYCPFCGAELSSDEDELEFEDD